MLELSEELNLKYIKYLQMSDALIFEDHFIEQCVGIAIDLFMPINNLI